MMIRKNGLPVIRVDILTHLKKWNEEALQKFEALSKGCFFRISFVNDNFVLPVFETWGCTASTYVGNDFVSRYPIQDFEKTIFTSIDVVRDFNKVYINFVDEDMRPYSIEYFRIKYNGSYKEPDNFRVDVVSDGEL